MPTQGRGLEGTNELVSNHNGGHYKIRIKGHLDKEWLDWFEGVTLRYVRNRQTGLELTELRGIFADQPALHGMLAKIRDLNLTLISVRKVNPVDPGYQKRRSRARPRSKRD